MGRWKFAHFVTLHISEPRRNGFWTAWWGPASTTPGSDPPASTAQVKATTRTRVRVMTVVVTLWYSGHPCISVCHLLWMWLQCSVQCNQLLLMTWRLCLGPARTRASHGLHFTDLSLFISLWTKQLRRKWRYLSNIYLLLENRKCLSKQKEAVYLEVNRPTPELLY